MFKRIFKGVKRAFRGASKFVKKYAPIALATAAVYFMAGASLAAPSWKSAIGNLVTNLGGQGGVLSNVLASTLTGAGRGAAVGAATNAVRGKSISKGAGAGALAGGAVGAAGGILNRMGRDKNLMKYGLADLDPTIEQAAWEGRAENANSPTQDNAGAMRGVPINQRFNPGGVGPGILQPKPQPHTFTPSRWDDSYPQPSNHVFTPSRWEATPEEANQLNLNSTPAPAPQRGQGILGTIGKAAGSVGGFNSTPAPAPQRGQGILGTIGKAAGSVGGFISDNSGWLGPALVYGAQAYGAAAAQEPHQDNVDAPWYDWYLQS